MTRPTAIPLYVEVTEHAIDRYCERIENLPRAEVIEMILRSARVIRIAAGFGATIVKVRRDFRLVLVGAKVVTVLGPEQFQMRSRPMAERI